MFAPNLRSFFVWLLISTTVLFSSCKKDESVLVPIGENPQDPGGDGSGEEPGEGQEEAPKYDPNGGILAYYDFSDDVTDKGGNEYHATIVGEPAFVEGHEGKALYLNETDGTNSCDQLGGQYVKLPAFREVWEKGFTISAWVEFKENRRYERIFDMGNGLGETNGRNVTFSRLEDTDDLVLTSWVNSDPEFNRIHGRVVAEGVIENGKMQHYAATISPEGVMKIFVNGEKVAERTDGNPVLNVYREKNYIGHSSYCYLDPDLKGIIDEVRIYNTALSEQEILDLFNH